MMIRLNLYLCLSLMLCPACSLVPENTVLAVGSSKNTDSTKMEALKAPGSQESLSSGDIFELKVFNEEELSGKFRVSDAGEVTLPLIGRLSVTGLSLAAVEDEITKRFKKFIKEPQISVFVEAFKGRKVYVFGRVNEPGTMVYESGMSIIEVITRAGGLHDLADADATSITRVVDGNEQKIIVSLKKIRQGQVGNVQVMPGDIIFVPESVF